MDGKSLGLGMLLRPKVEPTRSPADEHREEGNALFREKRYSRAIWAYSQAIEADPKDARSWANRASAQMGELSVLFKTLPPSAMQNNSYYKEGMRDLEQALAIDPGYVRAWARKGQLYVMAGEKGKALECYEEGLKVDPNSPECKTGRDACLH